MRISHLTTATAIALASTGASILFACGGTTVDPGAPSDSGAPHPDATTVIVLDAGSPVVAPTDASATSDVSVADASTNPCATPSATGFVTAPHGPLPPTVYGGGGILAAPKVVTVTFSDTANPAKLAAFGQTITQTPYFAEISKDYCIDDGGTCIQGTTPGIAIALDAGSAGAWVDNSFNGPTDPPSDAGVDFVPYLLSLVDQTNPGGLAAADPNAIYTFYFSQNTTFYMGDPNLGGAPGCQSFGGYHYAAASLPDGGGTPITYAIIVDCGGGIDELTVAASHEIIEATTDPYDGTGWYLDQGQNDEDASVPPASAIRDQGWADTDSFGEIGDNCEGLIDSSWTLDGGTVVQRIWSRSAAAAGQNPCVPVPAGETYYNVTPDKAVYVAEVGSSFTVDVTGFSPTPRAGWAVQAIDGTPNQLFDGGTAAPMLDVEFVGGSPGGNVAPGGSQISCINNGTSAQLKVTLLSDPAADPALNNDYVQPFWQQAEGLLVSLDTTGAPQMFGGSTYYPYQVFPFAVVTPATAASIGLTSSGLSSDIRRPPTPRRTTRPRTWAKPVHTQPWTPRARRLK